MTHGPSLGDDGSQSLPEPEQFAQMVQHSPDAICVHQDGRIVFVNVVALQWLGARSAPEVLGHAVSHFLHAQSLPLVTAGMATLRQPGDVSSPSLAKLVRLDGSESLVEAVTVMTTWYRRPAYQLVLRQLTEHRPAQDTLAHQAALVEHASEAIIAITRTGLVTSWNPAAEDIYQRPAQRALALPIDVAVGAPVDLDAIIDAGGVVHSTHYAMDGAARAIRISMTTYEHGYVLLCSDETALRRAARNLRTIVNTLQEGVVVVDRDGWLLTINPAARRMLGIKPGQQHVHHGDIMRQLPIFDTDGVPLREHERPIFTTIATGLPIIGRILGVDRSDGRRIWMSTSCQLLHPEDRDHSPVLISFADVTERHAATQHLAHQAAHDVLTGLPNRAHIVRTVDSLNRRGGLLTAVLFIDLDDLKTVNDNFGHEAGDRVITTTADRLRRAVRKHDIVGRLAGDEFVALLTGHLDPSALDGFVDRIRRALRAPIEIPGGTVQVAASIGVVQTDRADSRDAATLLHEADKAMYAAKARGRRASYFSRLSPSRR